MVWRGAGLVKPETHPSLCDRFAAGRLREGAAPIRRILIFDDHPATIRLLEDVDLAVKRKNKLALVGCCALIVLVMLAMFWPLL